MGTVLYLRVMCRESGAAHCGENIKSRRQKPGPVPSEIKLVKLDADM